LLLPLALFLFTAYAFFQPGLWLRFHPVFIVIVLLCLLQHILNRTIITFCSTVYWIFGYIVLGGISIVLPPTYLATKALWIDAVIAIAIGLIVWSAFSTADQKTEKIIEWFAFTLCILLAAAIILQNIAGGRFSPRKIECLAWLSLPQDRWIQKYQEVWLLLLTWVGIAYVHFTKRRKEFIAGFMLLVCGLALFSGYSEGSQIAFIVSTVFFIYGSIVNKFPKKILIFLVIGIGISIPVCWVIGHLFSQVADVYMKILNVWGNENISSRSVIWDYALQAILCHPWTGFGFGAANTINLPLYPGKHPHSISIMILLDLGLLGFVFYIVFLACIIVKISRAPVFLFATMAAGSLMLSCVIIWQVSFPFWNLDCLLLLFISCGLMGLRLRSKEAEKPILAGNVIKYSYKNKTILLLLLVGAFAFGINYIPKAYFIKKIENAEIILSQDLSKIIIDGQASLISHQWSGILKIKPGDSRELTFWGWAGDISGERKAQAVIIFYERKKIAIAIPSIYRPGLRKLNADLLFSGFSYMIDDAKYDLTDLKKIKGVALFDNGEACFLYIPERINWDGSGAL
jgi:hypothetical protein